MAAYSDAMRILALDSALARARVGVVVDDELRAARAGEGGRGEAERLPGLVTAALAEAGVAPLALDLVAVTLGPGSFTGIRAALALAQGIGLGSGIPVVGVTVGEAIAHSLPNLGGRILWVATDSRRGRVFVERGPAAPGAEPEAFALDALPPLTAPVALAGDAGAEVASRLAARDLPVMLTDARYPLPRHIALAALERHRGELPPRLLRAVYVDPPEAKPPAGGLRPPPAG